MTRRPRARPSRNERLRHEAEEARIAAESLNGRLKQLEALNKNLEKKVQLLTPAPTPALGQATSLRHTFVQGTPTSTKLKGRIK